MTPTVAEVLARARALPRDERAELAEELLRTLATSDVSVEVRLSALRDAVRAAEVSAAAGRADRIASTDLREYIREIGREAVAVAGAKSA